MLTFQECRRLAECWVETISRGAAALIDDATLERPYGWVFFYQSKSYLDTGNFIDAQAGNAPLIVDRWDGGLRVTGTDRPVEEYLREYEATLPAARLRTE